MILTYDGEKRMSEKRVFVRRLWMSVAGVVLTALAVAMFKTAALGVDPFQSFVSGVDAVLPLSYGTVYSVLCVILLCFSLICDRHYLGLATFINLFLLGYMVEFFQKLCFGNMTELSLSGQVVLFAGAFILLCFSASLYITADLGVSAYDAVALILTNKFHLGKFKFVRITTDVVCVAVGVACYILSCGTKGLETVVGVATIVTAFGMGPFIDWFNRKLVEPFFYRGQNRV